MLYTTSLGLSPPSARPHVCISPTTTSVHMDFQRAGFFPQCLSSALWASVCALGHTRDHAVGGGSGGAGGSGGNAVPCRCCPCEHSAVASSQVWGPAGRGCWHGRMISDAVLAACPCSSAQQHFPSLPKLLWKGMGRGFPRTAEGHGRAGWLLEVDMLEGAWSYGQGTHRAQAGCCCLASPRAGSLLASWPLAAPCPRLSGLQGVPPRSRRTRGLGALRCAGCFTSPICFPTTAAIWLFPSLDTFFLTPRFSTRLSGFSACGALASAAISKSPGVQGSSLHSGWGGACGCSLQGASTVFYPIAAFCPKCCHDISPPRSKKPMGNAQWVCRTSCFQPYSLYRFMFVKPSHSGSFPMGQKGRWPLGPQKRARPLKKLAGLGGDGCHSTTTLCHRLSPSAQPGPARPQR